MDTMLPGSTVTRTRTLNDALRRTFTGGKVMMTAGISALPPTVLTTVLSKVRNFNTFTADNDPYGEHDFGKFEHAGNAVMFKIDYYDQNMGYGSPDPSDEKCTTRVLTVMLASEY